MSSLKDDNEAGYFDMFGLEKSYDIDKNLLEQNYFRLQKAFHPDKFANASSSSRQAAILRSMEINNIYEILADDFERAKYLCAEHGFIIGTDKDTVKPSEELLMKNIEQREALASGDNLQELFEKAQFERKSLIEQISKCFDGRYYLHAAEYALELLYLDKFLDEVKRKL